MTGIDMKHVPYRGGGPALNDVVAGHVPVYFADAGPAAALIKAGQLKALGVTTATRDQPICRTCRRCTRPASPATRPTPGR